MVEKTSSCRDRGDIDETISAMGRRIAWLRHALYDIEVGRSSKPREAAHKALEIDDMISGRTPLPAAGQPTRTTP